MSYELVAKVSYNKVDEALTVFSNSNNCWPRSYTNGHTITADSVRNTPEYVTSNYEKVMFALYRGLMEGGYSLNSTVSAKYRNAYNIIVAFLITHEGGISMDNWNTDKLFILFLDAVEGKEKPTTGKFIVLTNYFNNGSKTYFKSENKDTSNINFAKIFKTEEEAIIKGSNRIGSGEVIEVVV